MRTFQKKFCIPFRYFRLFVAVDSLTKVAFLKKRFQICKFYTDTTSSMRKLLWKSLQDIPNWSKAILHIIFIDFDFKLAKRI